jgi:hypothetical protein
MTKNEILAALKMRDASQASFARRINAKAPTVQMVIRMIGNGKIDAEYFSYVKAEEYQRITNALSAFIGKDVLKKTKRRDKANEPTEYQI